MCPIHATYTHAPYVHLIHTCMHKGDSEGETYTAFFAAAGFRYAQLSGPTHPCTNAPHAPLTPIHPIHPCTPYIMHPIHPYTHAPHTPMQATHHAPGRPPPQFWCAPRGHADGPARSQQRGRTFEHQTAGYTHPRGALCMWYMGLHGVQDDYAEGWMGNHPMHHMHPCLHAQD